MNVKIKMEIELKSIPHHVGIFFISLLSSYISFIKIKIFWFQFDVRRV